MKWLALALAVVACGGPDEATLGQIVAALRHAPKKTDGGVTGRRLRRRVPDRSLVPVWGRIMKRALTLFLLIGVARADFISSDTTPPMPAEKSDIATCTANSLRCAWLFNAIRSVWLARKPWIINWEARIAKLKDPLQPGAAPYGGAAWATGGVTLPVPLGGANCAHPESRLDAATYDSLLAQVTDLAPYGAHIETRILALESGTVAAHSSVGSSTDYIQAGTPGGKPLAAAKTANVTACPGETSTCMDKDGYNAERAAGVDVRAHLVTILADIATLEAERSRPAPGSLAALPLGAFPGCEGAGCSTRAGWNSAPTLYFVTTPADSGVGSLRACVEASGPRVCLFQVAGEISTSGLAVNNPYLSLRCDTAPGDGVQINQHGKTACGGNGGYTFVVQTHDVLIRGCRIREGANIATGSDCRAFAFSPGAVHGDIHHVVVDHSSFSWGHDQVADIGAWSYSSPATLPRDSQYGWSFIYEGLDKGGNNSRGSLMDDGEDAGHDQYMTDLDLHHNLWANNVQRNPLVRFARARVVNNLVYNWATAAINPWGYPGDSYGTFSIDLIGNVAKSGPMTPGSGAAHGMVMLTYDNQSVFLSGNHYAGGSEQGWGSAGITYEVGSGQTHRTNALAPASSGPAITVTTDETTLVNAITGSMGAGASRRLDCGGNWVDNRDSADARVLGYWVSPSSGPSAAVASVPAWPSVTAIASTTVCASNARDNSACVCADTDRDGIPDYWERAMCGTSTGCDPQAISLAGPWTNLEAYLSGFMPVP